MEAEQQESVAHTGATGERERDTGGRTGLVAVKEAEPLRTRWEKLKSTHEIPFKHQTERTRTQPDVNSVFSGWNWPRWRRRLM